MHHVVSSMYPGRLNGPPGPQHGGTRRSARKARTSATTQKNMADAGQPCATPTSKRASASVTPLEPPMCTVASVVARRSNRQPHLGNRRVSIAIAECCVQRTRMRGVHRPLPNTHAAGGRNGTRYSHAAHEANPPHWKKHAMRTKCMVALLPEPGGARNGGLCAPRPVSTWW